MYTKAVIIRYFINYRLVYELDTFEDLKNKQQFK